jgi:NNP family nitrate/nitrite transporter-like MFS transporter
MGMLTDRLGGRKVFTGLFVLSAVAAVLVPQAKSFLVLVAFAFFIGVAGSSFAVGVGYVSRWFTPEQQGAALGVYGLGNIGQSLVVFLGPVLASRVGRTNIFYGVGAAAAIWAVIFFLLARDAPAKKPAASIGAMLSVLTSEPLAWVLSAFYFLTFGAFVAFSIYLPSLLRDEFKLTAADAGFRPQALLCWQP